MACVRCGLTAEAIVAGRDKPATWEDVDRADRAGFRRGYQFARADFRRRRRRKVFIAGSYWTLRRMEQSLLPSQADAEASRP